MEKRKLKISPQLFIIITFVVTILCGTLCLIMPFATTNNQGLPFIDALFIATSATCVTGLSPIVCGVELTLFGQIILAILIEIGGLSFLSVISFIFIVFGRKMDINQRFLLKEQLNLDSIRGIVRVVKRIIILSLSVQIIGAFIFFFIFKFSYNFPVGTSIKLSLFQALSAFNNAGFDLFKEGTSMAPYRNDILLNVVTMMLIVLGGIGFVVIHEIFKKRSWRRLSLNTKVVLVMTVALIFGGAFLFKLFMWNDLSFMDAIFSSVTARTAGFATIDMSTLNMPSYILMLFLMFIGASPCSTGGGLKTTTFFVLVLTLIANIKGTTPHAFSRKITKIQMQKACSLFTLEIIYLISAILGVSIAENIAGNGIGLGSIVFEVVSAFATVGLSQGITASLCLGSKIIIILTMFIGRLGPLTMVTVWFNRKTLLVENDIKYVEGKIMIG